MQGDVMEFLTPGERIRKLRTKLKLKQEDLQGKNVTRAIISMIETNKRELTHRAAVKIAKKLKKRAEELSIDLYIDKDYLMLSKRKEAEIYCLDQLRGYRKNVIKTREVLKIAAEYGLLEIQAKVYCNLAEICSDERDFYEAYVNYKRAKEIYISINNNEKLGYIYWKIGVCKANNLKYNIAIEYYELSQHYCLVNNDSKTKKLCLYSLANSYKKINEIDLALNTIDKYLSLCDEKEDYRLYIYAYGVKATCYETKKDYDAVIDTYKFMLTKILDSTDIPLGYIYNNLGLAYCYKNDFQESMKYFDLAESFRRKIDKANLSATLIEKANVFIKQNLYAKAIKTIELGLSYAKTYKDSEYLLKGNYILADIYDDLKDNKNLEKTYLKIIKLLKNNDEDNLRQIYNKLAFMYLKNEQVDLCEKYLHLLSVEDLIK